MAGEVGKLVPLAVLRLLEREGLRTADLFEGLGVTPDDLRSRRARMSWGDWIEFVERAVDRCGGVEPAAAIARKFDQVTPFVDWNPTSLLSPDHQLRFWGLLAPALLGGVNHEIEETPTFTRLRLRVQPDPPAQRWLLVGAQALAETARGSGSAPEVVCIEALAPDGITLRVDRAPRDASAPAEFVLRAVTRAGTKLGRCDPDNALAELLVVLDGVRVVDAGGGVVAKAGRGSGWTARKRVCRDGRVVGAVEAAASPPATGELACEALVPWLAAAWGRLAPAARDDGVLARAGALFLAERNGRMLWANAAGWAWLGARSDRPQRLVAAARGGGDDQLVAFPAGDALMLLPRDPEAELAWRLDRAATRWGLTDRERGALGLVCRGLSNKEIAAESGTAEATVETHLTRLFRKSGAAGRVALARQVWLG